MKLRVIKIFDEIYNLYDKLVECVTISRALTGSGNI